MILTGSVLLGRGSMLISSLVVDASQIRRCQVLYSRFIVSKHDFCKGSLRPAVADQKLSCGAENYQRIKLSITRKLVSAFTEQ